MFLFPLCIRNRSLFQNGSQLRHPKLKLCITYAQPNTCKFIMVSPDVDFETEFKLIVKCHMGLLCSSMLPVTLLYSVYNTYKKADFFVALEVFHSLHLLTK